MPCNCNSSLLPGWEGRRSDHKFHWLRRGQYRAVLPFPNNAVYVKRKQCNTMMCPSIKKGKENTLFHRRHSITVLTFNIEINNSAEMPKKRRRILVINDSDND